MSPDWLSPLASLLAALFGAICGGVIGHKLALVRDSKNGARERRVEHLISAYRRLVSASNRLGDQDREQKAGVEDALSDVILLGKQAEIDAARNFMILLANNGDADLDPLIAALRESLRQELRLKSVPLPTPIILRFSSEESG